MRLPFHSGVSLLLLGYSLLDYEMALTRVCSALFSYHFSFLAVSMALLGLGIGGLLLGRRSPAALADLDGYFVAYSAGIVAFTLVAFLVPVQGISWTPALILLTALGTFPFVCCGVIICAFLSRFREEAGKVYAFDLAGGALACLTVNTSLNWIGPVQTLLMAAALGSASGAMLGAPSTPRLRLAGPLTLGLVIAMFFQVSTNAIRMKTFYEAGEPKPVYLEMWNCLSRISVVWAKNGEQTYARFCIDTGADTWAAPPDHPIYNPSDVAYAMRPGGRYAVIGPGAGADVLMGIPYKPSSFDLIEINPIMIRLVQTEFDNLTGGLYRRPEMHIHIGDGRSFMDRTRQKFDVLVISLVDTFASVSGGAYALSENYLYTVDAIDSYLDRVSPDGVLCLSRWPVETPRLVGLVRTALEKRGAKRPLDHMFMVMSRYNQMTTLLINPRPWTSEELAQLHALARSRTLPVGLTPTSDPSREALAAAATSSLDLEALNRSCPVEMSPVTDDRPFFLFFWKPASQFQPTELGDLTLPWKEGATLRTLGLEHLAQYRSTTWILSIPVALGLACSLLVGWLACRVTEQGERLPVSVPLYFSLLGLGFMLFEISLAQRLVLLLGHPAYAISIVLFSFLVCGALGSALSQRIPSTHLRQGQIAASLSVFVLACLAAWCYPMYVGHFLSESQTVRTLASFFWIAPLGTMAGMLFPLGLRRVSEQRVRWIWALNGGASVAGSAATVALGLYWGFDRTTYLGGATYLLVALIAWRFPFEEKVTSA